jgi:hypothetical protein
MFTIETFFSLVLRMSSTPSGQSFEQKFTREMGKLESWLEPIFSKLPHIPLNARETLVRFAPWLSLVFGILGLGALSSIGAFATLFSPLMLLTGGFAGILVFANILIGLLASVLEIIAFKPLQSFSKKGWNYLFYGTVLGGVSHFIGMLFMTHGGEGILGTLVGLWLLFEIRPVYKA